MINVNLSINNIHVAGNHLYYCDSKTDMATTVGTAATLLRNEFVVGALQPFCLIESLPVALPLALSFCCRSNEPIFGAHTRVRARRTFLRTNRFGTQKRIASFKNILEGRRSIRNFRLMVHRCTHVCARAFFCRWVALITILFPHCAVTQWQIL